LRRTQAGNIVLHAVRADSGEHRSYRVDRIQNARTTEQTFIPRYAIELTPSGPIVVPSPVRTSSFTAQRLTSPRRLATIPRPGPTYIYQCSQCGKRFERKTQDATLRPHKSPSGWPCSGRGGMLMDTRW
jgi:hypothetical protein